MKLNFYFHNFFKISTLAKTIYFLKIRLDKLLKYEVHSSLPENLNNKLKLLH